MKIAIVGSRKYLHEQQVRDYVRALPSDTVIVSGGADGVDTWAEMEAGKCGLRCIIYRPETRKFRTFWEAAKARNIQIVQEADEVVAFHYAESSGTAHTIKMARFYGKPVKVIIP